MKNLNKLIFTVFISFSPALKADVDASKKDKAAESSLQTSNKKIPAKKIDITKHKISDSEIQKIKQEAQSTKAEWSIRAGKSTSLSTTKRMLRAQQYISAKDYDGAIKILDRVIDRSSTSKYERAKALFAKAQALMSLKKYSQTEAAIKESLDLDIMSYYESLDALMFLAQIQLITQNFKEAKKNIVRYIEISPNQSPMAFVILASVNFELEENKEAEVNIEKAISNTKKPQEAWLYFASAIYNRNKKFPKAEEILKDLVEKRPKNRNYWMSLIAVLFEQEKSTEALKYMELAQKLNFLKSEGETMNRISLLVNEKIPFKAAKILEENIENKKIKDNKKNYEMLASFWFLAKEYDKSIAAYKKASKFSKSGDVELLLGQVYIEKEDWRAAENHFRTALKKGNLKSKAGYAYIGLGMTSFFQDDKQSALNYFAKAKNFKSQKEVASKWLGYLN